MITEVIRGAALCVELRFFLFSSLLAMFQIKAASLDWNWEEKKIWDKSVIKMQHERKKLSKAFVTYEIVCILTMAILS